MIITISIFNRIFQDVLIPIMSFNKKYDKIYMNNKHILEDSIKDRNGNYHDDIIYEIIVADQSNNTLDQIEKD